MTSDQDRWALYDLPGIQAEFVTDRNDGDLQAVLGIEGLHCGGCVRRCELGVLALAGVDAFEINLSSRRGSLVWNPKRVSLSEVLGQFDRLGFRAYPYNPAQSEINRRQNRHKALLRLAVAGFAAMQVMMFSTALYVGDYQDLDDSTRTLLRWMALLVTVPVVFYSARPFFINALSGLRQRRLGMDLPVAIAIASAFLASSWGTFSGGGQVYFDSVVMFTFLLLLGRFLETMARQRALQACEDLAQTLPATATRLQDGRQDVVPIIDLRLGDLVLVKPGETVPADGSVIDGGSSLDESMLTGESSPQCKRPGDRVIAGTINVESPLTIAVERLGEETRLAAMNRLLRRAQLDKPRLARVADRIAAWFVGAQLLVAAGVFLVWWQTEPGSAFWVTLSVLVVTCPCALSLATPTALVVASGSLARIGLLPTRGHALETLARVSHLVFDKTGTLTFGRPHLLKTVPLRNGTADDIEHSLAVAAALEKQSEHPIAKALVTAADTALAATQVVSIPGQGVQGVVNDILYRIGSPSFAGGLSGAALPAVEPDDGATWVALGDRQGLLAQFKLVDELRPEAPAAVAALRERGIAIEILSGDGAAAVAQVAVELSVSSHSAGLMPEDKLRRIRQLQAEGVVVAAIGDGVNDSPLLAQAQVSVAMGGGTELARGSADWVLMSDNLQQLPLGVAAARRTLRIIKQNLGWAILYNAIAVPLAALGYVAPWMAAIGMSCSSLLVVVNALRLSRVQGSSERSAVENEMASLPSRDALPCRHSV